MAAKRVPSSERETVKLDELSVLTMSDHDIMSHIQGTHIPGDEKFDVDSLFLFAENILKRASIIVDNVALDLLHGTVVNLESLDDLMSPRESFNPPLCTLKRISGEMQCKTADEEIAHKITMSILNKLSCYSWDAKAVLTLAAFALDFGDFWLLAQLHPTDHQLAKSVGILKKVPSISRRPGLQKHQKSLIELNVLIQAILEMMECILELEKLSAALAYKAKYVPEPLSIAMEHLPVDVYWVILAIVACSTKMCGLTRDEEQVQELAPFAHKLNIVLYLLKMQIKICKQQMMS